MGQNGLSDIDQDQISGATPAPMLFAGMLIAQFGGFGKMAVAFSFIYILGFVLVPVLPETKGKPLPA